MGGTENGVYRREKLRLNVLVWGALFFTLAMCTQSVQINRIRYDRAEARVNRIERIVSVE